MNENNINTDAVAENAEEEKRTPQQAVYDWIEIVAVSLSVVLLFLTFIARVTTVVGDSMLPTLHDGESLLVIGIGYTPKSGDDNAAHPWIKVTGTLKQYYEGEAGPFYTLENAIFEVMTERGQEVVSL